MDDRIANVSYVAACRRSLVLCLCPALACWLALLAVASPMAGQVLNFTSYGHAQGLPQAQITALYQDAAGFLWIGSNSGISRYDGSAFHSLSARDGLSDNIVSSLAGTGDVLYVGTVRGGVCTVRGGRAVRCLRATDGLPSDQVNGLRVDAGDTLWVSTSGGLAVVRQDSVLRTYTSEAGLPRSGTVGSWVVDGHLWTNTPAGPYVFQGGRFHAVEGIDPAGSVRVILPLERGAYFAGPGGLFRYDDGKVRKIEVPDLPRGSGFTDAALDASGTAWFTTLDGVVSYDGRSARHLSTENGLTYDQVNCMLVDHEGDLWFGTDRGLSELVPGPLALFGTSEGLPNPVARAIAEDDRGRLWVGTRRGAAVLDGDHFRPVPLPDGVANPSVWSLATPPEGGMLVATQSNLVYYGVDGTRVYGVGDGLPARRVNTLTADSSGVWVGTSGGLVRWKAGRILPVDAPELAGLFVMSTVEDEDGRLWIGPLPGGLLVLGPHGVARPGGENGLTRKAIWQLSRDRNGSIWAGTNGDGALSVAGDSVRRITTQDGLVNDFVWQVLPDSRGNVWFFTSNGLDRLTKDGSIVHYGAASGLTDLEGTAAGALEDRRGILWFGSSSGVFRYDAHLDVPEETPPPIYIESLSAHRVSYPTVHAELPAQPGVVRVGFVSPTFRDQLGVRFRYRLSDQGSEWSDPMLENTVSLAGLGPGTHTLQVEAINGDGVHSGAPATTTFTILPSFWQTWWFRVALLLLAASMVAGLPLYRARRLEMERSRLEGLVHTHTRELEARANHLEREISERKRLQERVLQSQRMETAGRLAAGVAHEFNNLLQSVLGHAQLIQEQMPADEPLRGDVAEIEGAALRGARLVSHLLGFSRQQLVQDQVVDVGAVVRELHSLVVPLAGPGVQLQVSVDDGDFAVRFDPQQLRQIVMNLVTNAVDAMDHEGCLTVAVATERIETPRTTTAGSEIRAGDHVTLTVTDTGPGIEPRILDRIFEPFFTTRDPALYTGLGLSLVYGAVRGFSGGVDVVTEPGTGTTFRIFLPRVSA